MKNLIYIIFFLPFFAQAQMQASNGGNQNANQINIQVAINANDISPKKPKKPYCKECEEIKKLKKQQKSEHFSSGVSGGKKKNHHLQHFYFRTTKKMNRVFGKHKKKKLDYNYSCFVW